jgi:flagellar assembly protein FliH
VENQSGAKPRILKKAEDQDLDVWPLPSVDTQPTPEQANKTNAFGQKSNWRFEPPEQEAAIEPVPLTAEELEEIRQAAYEEGLEQGKEQGFKQGHEEGKTQGHQEGLTQGQAEGHALGLDSGKQAIEQLTLQWQSLIQELHQPMDNVNENVEQQLLELVVQLTQAVVLHEAKTNPDIILAAISQGIKALPSNELQTQIYLHPSDIKLVEREFGGQHIQENGWRLMPAPQLDPGSCQIENNTANIDLRMKSRLKQVLDSFLQEALYQ